MQEKLEKVFFVDNICSIWTKTICGQLINQLLALDFCNFVKLWYNLFIQNVLSLFFNSDLSQFIASNQDSNEWSFFF
jgi:hypothetical protein